MLAGWAHQTAFAGSAPPQIVDADELFLGPTRDVGVRDDDTVDRCRVADIDVSGIAPALRLAYPALRISAGSYGGE
jgi:hypothetical protein